MTPDVLVTDTTASGRGIVPPWTRRAAPGAVGLFLLLALAALAWGLRRHWEAFMPLWRGDSWSAIGWAWLVVGAWMLLGMLLRLPGRLMLVALPLLAAGATLGLGATATALLVFASALQIGALLLPRLWLTQHSLLGVEVAIATGLAILALLLQAFAMVPVHFPVVHLALLVAPFLWMPDRARDMWRHARLMLCDRALPGVWDGVFWAIAIGASLVRLLGVFAPEAGLDALGMHLQMPAMVARDHVWLPSHSGFVWAWMPMAADWIYTLAYSLSGEAAARLVNYGADLLILIGCAGLARAVAGPRAAALAAVLYSTLPLTYLVTTSLFVENLWTLWTGAAVALAVALSTERVGGRAYVALGLLCAAALAAKLMTVLWAPLLLLFVIVHWRHRDAGAKLLIAAIVLAILGGAWPYVTAWIGTGNPIFPFMNNVFQSPLYNTTTSFASVYHEPLGWRMLYSITFLTDRYIEAPTGAAGILWLAILPAGVVAVLAWGGNVWRAIVLGALCYVLLVLWLTSNLRYTLPALPVLATAMGVGIARLPIRALRVACAAVVVLGGLAGIVLFAHSTWWYRVLVPLGPLDRTAYREWKDDMRPEAKIVDRANVLGLKNVLWLGRTFYAGLQARVTIDGWHQQSGWKQIDNPVQFARWMGRHQFDALVMAPGYDPCQKPWLCRFVKTLGEPEVALNGARLYRIPFDKQPRIQHVLDAGMRGSPQAWHGNGRWDREQGTVRVDAAHAFYQTVAVTAGQAYAYRVRERCHAGSALFLLRVRYIDARGHGLGGIYEPAMCSPSWKTHSVRTIAPDGAVEAVVFAAGFSRDREVEIDRVDLLE